MSTAKPSAQSLGQEVTAGDVLPRRPVRSLSDAVTGADLGDSFGPENADDTTESLDQRYEVLAPIGRGGMGDVFQGKDRKLGRDVAIKRIRDEFAGSRTAFERFQREAHAIAALNHPHIVRVFDFGRDEHGPFLVMELVEGESLAEQLARVGKLDEAMVRRLGEQLCDALAAAHHHGIIHRDVKPANVLLARSDRLQPAVGESHGDPQRPAEAGHYELKLTDFGLARDHTAGGGMTQSGAVLGTLDFMPPEQRRDAQAVDERSDLWSLGATLYQLLTGEPPRILRSDRLPASLRDPIVKSLEPNPDDRFQTADEFRAALRDVSHTLAVPAASATRTCHKCDRQNAEGSEFCAGCGTSLADDPCLRCGQLLPAGAEFCGQCGGNVAAEVERRRAELVAERTAVEILARSGLVKEATSRLERMAAAKHSALDETVGWAARNLVKSKERWARLVSHPEELLVMADDLFDDGDYQGAAAILEQLDPPRRTPGIRKLLEECEGRQKRIAYLSRKIRHSVAAKDFDDLLPAVDEYLKLKPDDDDVRRLRAKLRKRPVRSDRLEPGVQVRGDRLQPVRRRRRPAKAGHYERGRTTAGHDEQSKGLPLAAWGGISAGVLVAVVGLAWLVRFAFVSSSELNESNPSADSKSTIAATGKSSSPVQIPPAGSNQIPPPSNNQDPPPSNGLSRRIVKNDPPPNGLPGSIRPRRSRSVVEYEVLTDRSRMPTLTTLRRAFLRVRWAQAGGVTYDANRHVIVVPTVGGAINTGIGKAALKSVGVDVGRQSIRAG